MNKYHLPLRLRWTIGADPEFRVVYDPNETLDYKAGQDYLDGSSLATDVHENVRCIMRRTEHLGYLHPEVFENVWEMSFEVSSSPEGLLAKAKAFVNILASFGVRIRGGLRLGGHIHIGCDQAINIPLMDAAMALASAPILATTCGNRRSKFLQTGGYQAGRGGNTRIIPTPFGARKQYAYHVEWRLLPSPFVRWAKSHRDPNRWLMLEAWAETVHLGLWLYENARRFRKLIKLSSPSPFVGNALEWKALDELLREAMDLPQIAPKLAQLGGEKNYHLWKKPQVI